MLAARPHDCGTKLTNKLRTRSALPLLATALALAAGGATSREAGAIPAGFTDTFVASVESPTALAFMPDGRLLVGSQFGTLHVVAGGTLLPEAALDLGPDVCTSGEQGLLGVAADPAASSNGFLYVYYTRDKGDRCVNRLSRFTLAGGSASTETEVVLIDEIPAVNGNHNGGDVKLGKDGLLYVSVGDGGCDYAGGGCSGQNDAARDRNALVGKILRITTAGEIPASNPFQGPGTARCNVTGVTTAGTVCQETYAWGLRNPFRIAFDPDAPATRFFVNDVGDGHWEEVNEGAAGADYGWNVREGPCVNGSYTSCGAPPEGMTNPIHAYAHSESPCHAITGGAFVPDGVWPSAYDDSYLYGDYTCGRIFRLEADGAGGFERAEFATGVGAVVNLAFGPSPSGTSLYYTNYAGGGQVRRIDATTAPNRPPNAAVSAAPSSGPLPLDVSFDGSASWDPDADDELTYAWDFGDGATEGPSLSPLATHTFTEAGAYTATLTVTDAAGASSTATARIDAGNRAPEVSIDAPGPADTFAVGETIRLVGSATDPDEGALPAGRLSWRVLRHHDDHTHPYLAPTAGNDLTIPQPAPEDLASGIDGYLVVQLTATDSSGLSTTVSRDVFPEKVDLSFASDPSGRELVIGGSRRTAPTTVTSWVGHALSVDAPAQSDVSGSWRFDSWSDGGAAAHTIVTPDTPTTYTASFTRAATAPGLVAAYGFEEPGGASVVDASGRGHDGTLSGASRNPAGRHGAALVFDGGNDWVTVADAPGLDLAGAMTLEAWVRPTALGSWRTVVVKERAGGIVYSLYADQSGGRPVGQVDIGGEKNAVGGAPVPLNTWTHLAATYDGATVRLYVNGAPAGSGPATGTLPASSGPLRIGGNGVWSEWFAGTIDDVRVYERALSAAEIQEDMATPVAGSPPPPDTSPPSPPTGLNAAVAPGRVTLDWQDAPGADGVVRYNVHRAPAGDFEPVAGNRIAQPAGSGHADLGVAAGTHYYRVTAEDAAGNVSAPSAALEAVVPADEPPDVALTQPLDSTTVSGTVTLAASASDDVGVAGVRFRVGEVDLGAEDASPPYSHSWNTTAFADGVYALTALARDTAGQVTVSSSVQVTVANGSIVAPEGLVAAYSFDEGSGSQVRDASGRGNDGIVAGATFTDGHTGSALAFDGVDDWVTIADAAELDLTDGMTLEAWVRPAALGGWRTVVTKERSGGIVYGLVAAQGGSRPAGQVDIGGERTASGSTSLPLGTWSHVAATYDGAAVRLYVDGALAGSAGASGPLPASGGALRIGGNSIWSEWFSGLIDDVRVYDRPLSRAEIQEDRLRPVGSGAVPDESPPSTPDGVGASASAQQVSLDWDASSDDRGVARYHVHRGASATFAPEAGNRVGSVEEPGYVDVEVPAGTHFYRVVAEDGAGNVSAPSEAVEVLVEAPPGGGGRPGLVAAYGFDAGFGTVVADASGRGNNGTVAGASWTAAGRFGAALSFDGVDDWVTVPDAPWLDLTTAMTVEAWVLPTALGRWRTVVFKERPGGIVYSLFASQGSSLPVGQIYFGGERSATGASPLPLNAWSHLAVTYDGTTVRLFVDGVQRGSTVVSASMSPSSGPLRIGGNSVWSEWFAGLIDEVRVYDRALTAAEIQQDSQTPVN